MISLPNLGSKCSECSYRFFPHSGHLFTSVSTAAFSRQYTSRVQQQHWVRQRSREFPVTRRTFCALPPATIMAATSETQQDGAKNFKYIQLWVSADGETHIKECKFRDFDLKTYSSLPQYVKNEFGGQPKNIVFTELSPGLKQPLHPCPEVQFVITLSGSWYIETTDGSRYEFQPGEVLFQDNVKWSPAAKLPQHYSGVVGDQPCQQFIVQFDRAPEVDNPEPF